MKTNKFLKIVLLTFFMGGLSVHAQVTIGSEEPPAEGALLQVKNKTGVTNGSDNATKGFAFPRVALSHKKYLYPMFGSIGSPTTNYDQTAEITAMNNKHVGLIVYNTYESPSSVTNNDIKFRPGLYVWTGTEWGGVASSEVSNAMTQTDDGTIKWGGSLDEATTTITANAKNLVFDLKNIPDETDKGMMIKGLTTQPNSKAVVVDVNTGKLGISPVMPAVLAFIQSGNQSRVPGINTGAPQIVPWDGRDARDGGDIVENNGLVDFNDQENSFILKQDAMIEVSAMLGYIGGGEGGNEQVIVNATLQLKKAEAGSTWQDYSSVRGVYFGGVNWYRNTLNIPPAMIDAKEGDQIRLVVLRPPNESRPGYYLGHDHLTGTDKGIVRPYGTKFSKMLKIIVQGMGSGTEP